MLLSHTAGMPLGEVGVHYAPTGDLPSLEGSLSREARLVSEPGSSFHYSNVGYDLLELLIEEATGNDFAEYMQREVLEPLGMHRSSFTWSDLDSAVPTGYELDATPVPVHVYPAKASGGLFAPVEDVARFVAAGMTGRYYTDHGVLEEDSIERLYSATIGVSGIFRFVTESYGLGHFIETLSDGRKAV